jgi:hypothetical protein
MYRLKKFAEQKRPGPALGLVALVLLVMWMGAEDGGYFAGQWAPAALSWPLWR